MMTGIQKLPMSIERLVNWRWRNKISPPDQQSVSIIYRIKLQKAGWRIKIIQIMVLTISFLLILE